MTSQESLLLCQNEWCIVPQEDRAVIEIGGKDRATFLQGLFTQDLIKDFPIGNILYGIFPNLKGKILADAYVANLDDHTFILDVEAFVLPVLLKHLHQYLIGLEAQIIERGRQYRSFSFLGPEATHWLKRLLSEEPPSANQCSWQQDGRSFALSVARRDFKEYRVWVRKEFEIEFLSLIKDSRATVDKEVYETIQAESAIPKLGREMDENTFPQEVGLDEFLNFGKGCFLGAEVLQRIFHQGHVNRKLLLLSFNGSDAIPSGAPIVQSGAEVGKVTFSSLVSQNRPFAIGLVKISALEATPPAVPEPLFAKVKGAEILLKPLQGSSLSKSY